MKDFRSLIGTAPAGPRLELGVNTGNTLLMLANHADLTVGVDSFEGMPEPGPMDKNGLDNPYPRGRLKADFTTVSNRFVNNQNVVLIKGWIPEILEKLPQTRWAFVHIDLDHYEPTKASIAWVWDRMLPGGIICCDDYFENKHWLAAKAINERAAFVPFSGTEGRKAWWVLTGSYQPLSGR